jgi:hypothetical protein
MVEKVHQSAPRPVAEANPGTDPGKPRTARPTPGNANAPVRDLPDIKPDPKRASAPDIERGFRLLRDGKIADGEVQLQNGIESVVKRLAGKQNLHDYVLKTYGGRNAKDKAAIVNAVNEYVLRTKVIDGLLRAKTDDEKNRAKELAVHYVTDTGPDRMSPGGRLIFLTGHMLKAGVDKNIVNDVVAKIHPHKTDATPSQPGPARPKPEDANVPVRSSPDVPRETEREPPIAFVVAFREIENNRPDNASSFITEGIWKLGERLASKQDFHHDFAKARSARSSTPTQVKNLQSKMHS